MVLCAHCNAKTPELIVGKWRVAEFAHSIKEFNSDEKLELEKRAKSTTYEFKSDFSIRVTSGFSKSSKLGTWYWDPYREKLVINNNTILEENVDTIFIREISSSEMIWRQTFDQTDTSYIYLKRVE